MEWDKKHPFSQEKIDDLLSCLYEVGKSKAMGNLGIYTLRDQCGVSIEEILHYAEENNLRCLIDFNPKIKISLGNECFRKALLDTGDATLTHSYGRDDPYTTVLTEKEFCTRLMELRQHV